MSDEWFFKLKEFDSLGKMKNGHLKSIQEEQNRLSSLNIKRQEVLSDVATLKNELLQLQQEYFEAEKKMNSHEEQAARLSDMGGDQVKIAQFKKDANHLENRLFELLERTEDIQVELDEKKTFLSGLEKTYQEIEVEVQGEIQIHQLGVDQADMRMKLIEEELPSDFKSLLIRTLKKNLAVGSFTRTDNGSCFFCRSKISRTEESEIDMQKLLKTCPQCSRIFLPYGI